jgi:hypothetical protein
MTCVRRACSCSGRRGEARGGRCSSTNFLITSVGPPPLAAPGQSAGSPARG